MVRLFVNLWISTTLLANSVDRLLVVTNPLYHHAKQSKIIISLMLVSFAVPFITIALSIIVELNLPPRRIAAMCRLFFLFCFLLVEKFEPFPKNYLELYFRLQNFYDWTCFHPPGCCCFMSEHNFVSQYFLYFWSIVPSFEFLLKCFRIFACVE